MAEANRVTKFGTEEFNLGRSFPLLGLNRVATDFVGWTKTSAVDHLHPVIVTCVAGPDQVVPHGMDGDTMFGLTSMYVFQGMPDNGVIRTTVAELCEVLGLARSKHIYTRLIESIERLSLTKYNFFESWLTPSKKKSHSWRSVTLSIIITFVQTDVDVSSDVKPGTFRPSTQLEITLHPELANSIQDGNFRSVDLDFYGSLEQPLSRMLYRALDDWKYRDSGCKELSFDISAWGEHLGLIEPVRINRKPVVTEVKHAGMKVLETRVISQARIRRALDPAHEELIQRGFLNKVDYVGRGSGQTIHYTFGTPQSPVDLELIGLLTQRGMSPKVAEQNARTYGPKAVNRAVEVFDARKTAGYMVRNAGGLLTDILVNPDKYVPMDASLPAKTGSVKPSKPVKPIIEAALAEPSIDEKRKTNAFVVDGWAKRKWLVGQQHQQLLDLVKHGRLDDAKLVSLGLSDAVAVQKFAMEVLARG